MELTLYLPFVVFISAVIGGYVLYRNHRDVKNISYALTCFGISMWTGGLFLLQQGNSFYWPDKISLLGGFLGISGLYIFSNVFPTEARRGRYFLELLPLFCLVFFVPFNLFIKREVFVGQEFVPVNGPLFGVLMAVEFIYFIFIFKNFYSQYRNNLGYKRQRIVYVLSGLAFFAACVLFFDLILPGFGISAYKFIGPVSSAVFFILATVSVSSYNLLDVRLVFKAVLIYAFSIAVAIIMLVEARDSAYGTFLFSSPIFVLTFFAAIILFILIRNGANWIFSRFFLRSYFNFREDFDSLNLALHEEYQVSDIINAANKFFKHGLRLAWVYYLDARTREVIFEASSDPIVSGALSVDQINDPSLDDYAQTLHSPMFFYGIELSAFPKLSQAPIALLPIWEQGNFQGYFMLGPQLSLNGLSAEETHRIQSAWAHIETAFARARLYENLEQQVDAQVKDITYKNKVLKQMLKDQLDFVQVASHQLRTPITVLNSSLQQALVPAEPERQQEMVRDAYEHSKSLTILVENILRLAKIENVSQAEVSERIKLDDIFNEILPIIEAAARPKSLYISCEEMPEGYVIGNKEYLQQAFFNLLENAVQYTELGGVSVGFEKHPENIVVCIEDSGIGIPEKYRDQVFKKHVRTRGSKGIGLGLYIVKTIIDAHPGASISYESGASGTKFFVSLRRYLE